METEQVKNITIGAVMVGIVLIVTVIIFSQVGDVETVRGAAVYTTYNNYYINHNLSGQYSLEEDAADNYVNNSLNMLCNATSISNTEDLTTAGVYNDGFLFDDADTETLSLQCNDYYNYSYDDTFSISMYISPAEGFNEAIIMGDINEWGGTDAGWVLKILTGGKLAMIWTNGTTRINITSTEALLESVWYNVIYVNDLVDGVPNGRFYINGTLDNNNNMSFVEGVTTNDQRLIIGYAGNETGMYFNGSMDEIRFYDSALTLSDSIAMTNAIVNESWDDPDYSDYTFLSSYAGTTVTAYYDDIFADVAGVPTFLGIIVLVLIGGFVIVYATKTLR